MSGSFVLVDMWPDSKFDSIFPLGLLAYIAVAVADTEVTAGLTAGLQAHSYVGYETKISRARA